VGARAWCGQNDVRPEKASRSVSRSICAWFNRFVTIVSTAAAKQPVQNATFVIGTKMHHDSVNSVPSPEPVDGWRWTTTHAIAIALYGNWL